MLPWERFSRCTPQKSSEDCTYFDKVVVTNKQQKKDGRVQIERVVERISHKFPQR